MAPSIWERPSSLNDMCLCRWGRSNCKLGSTFLASSKLDGLKPFGCEASPRNYTRPAWGESPRQGQGASQGFLAR
eukprot:10020809-Alexandrium_andersonii.AAC.1